MPNRSTLRVPGSAHVEAATRRLVAACDPLRVLVFGSYARAAAQPGSDLDLLVVLPHVEDKRATAIALRRALADFPIPKDVVVTTPEEIERRGEIVGTLLHEALREGRVVYEREATP